MQWMICYTRSVHCCEGCHDPLIDVPLCSSIASPQNPGDCELPACTRQRLPVQSMVLGQHSHDRACVLVKGNVLDSLIGNAIAPNTYLSPYVLKPQLTSVVLQVHQGAELDG